jgi:hypothetical protein
MCVGKAKRKQVQEAKRERKCLPGLDCKLDIAASKSVTSRHDRGEKLGELGIAGSGNSYLLRRRSATSTALRLGSLCRGHLLCELLMLSVIKFSYRAAYLAALLSPGYILWCTCCIMQLWLR